jgi:hypothetical protein
MKRSDLIENIFKDLDKLHSKETIKSIIHLCEAYGMLPPKSGTKEKFCNNYDGSYRVNINK